MNAGKSAVSHNTRSSANSAAKNAASPVNTGDPRLTSEKGGHKHGQRSDADDTRHPAARAAVFGYLRGEGDATEEAPHQPRKCVRLGRSANDAPQVEDETRQHGERREGTYDFLHRGQRYMTRETSLATTSCVELLEIGYRQIEFEVDAFREAYRATTKR